jgi:hypothetical protein
MIEQAKQIGWFLAIWVVSVLTLAIIGLLIKAILAM